MRISETTFSKVDVEFMKSYLRIDEDTDEFISLLDYQCKEIIKLLNDFDAKIDEEGLIINILKKGSR